MVNLGATRSKKPVIYIASPYTKGDPAINTHFQCKIFDELMNDGRGTPVAPLWTHFQHTLFPRPYQDWVRHDLELIPLYDCCLRLNASHSVTEYSESESSGADDEVALFESLGKPVFYSVADLKIWLDSWGKS
ncbi:MAG: hypothetical protein DHS20C11_19890 [Lysobacteraceae bacterium]|nr:MAG: hypothetical protein DHS20C11_19890 [Xanthomonadaceae bacterium]